MDRMWDKIVCGGRLHPAVGGPLTPGNAGGERPCVGAVREKGEFGLVVQGGVQPLADHDDLVPATSSNAGLVPPCGPTGAHPRAVGRLQRHRHPQDVPPVEPRQQLGLPSKGRWRDVQRLEHRLVHKPRPAPQAWSTG